MGFFMILSDDSNDLFPTRRQGGRALMSRNAIGDANLALLLSSIAPPHHGFIQRPHKDGATSRLHLSFFIPIGTRHNDKAAVQLTEQMCNMPKAEWSVTIRTKRRGQSNDRSIQTNMNEITESSKTWVFSRILTPPLSSVVVSLIHIKFSPPLNHRA